MMYADTMEEYGVSAIVACVYDSLSIIAEGDEDLGNPLLWFVDAIAGQAELLESFVRYQNDRDGWANSMDPATIPAPGLPWLGQFVGVVTDPSSRVSVRDQVTNHIGFNRGSIPGITAYIQTYLTGLKRVRILERTTVVGGIITSGHPWKYTVIVRQEDLGDTTYDELAAQEPTYDVLAADFPTYEGLGSVLGLIEQAVQDSKPGGDLAYTILATVLYEDLYPGWTVPPPFPTYADLEAGFATYGAILAYSAP